MALDRGFPTSNRSYFDDFWWGLLICFLLFQASLVKKEEEGEIKKGGASVVQSTRNACAQLNSGERYVKCNSNQDLSVMN